MGEAKAVAVTGAAGFIGSHATVALAGAGIPVRVLRGPKSEIRQPPAVRQKVCFEGEITDATVLATLLQGAATVVHAAGPPSVAESFGNAVEYMRVHALGTATVLEACVRAGVRRIVHISSAEVYGNDPPVYVSETDPLLAASPYGAAKIAAEQIVRAFAVAGRIDAFVLRPFSVYGPGMPESSVVAQLLEQAAGNDVIRVRDVSPVRDFCYVSDISRAIVKACFTPLNGLAVANLGSGIPVSIGDLACIVARLAEAPGIEETGGGRPAGTEVRRLIANTTHAQTLLDWTTTTSLRDGLSETLNWMFSL